MSQRLLNPADIQQQSRHPSLSDIRAASTGGPDYQYLFPQNSVLGKWPEEFRGGAGPGGGVACNGSADVLFRVTSNASGIPEGVCHGHRHRPLVQEPCCDWAGARLHGRRLGGTISSRRQGYIPGAVCKGRLARERPPGKKNQFLNRASLTRRRNLCEY